MALQKSIKNKSGQALIDFLINLKLLVIFLSGFIALNYILFCQVMLEQNLYDSLFCVAEKKPRFVCEKNVRKKIKKFMIFGDLSYIKITSFRNKIKGQLEWKLNFLEKKTSFKIKKELSIKNLLRIPEGLR